MKVAFTVFIFALCCHCCFVSSAGILRMELFNGKKKCIGQDFDEGDLAVFNIGAYSSAGESSVTVTISDPDDLLLIDEKIALKDIIDTKTEIPLSIAAHGVHELCFKLHADSPVSINFGIDFKSRRSRQGEDPSKRIGKAELPSLETELLAAEESLNDISREIEFARKQEILLTQATESTGSRVQWFSIFSMVILLITSLWQIVYLRHFFTSKKIL